MTLGKKYPISVKGYVNRLSRFAQEDGAHTPLTTEGLASTLRNEIAKIADEITALTDKFNEAGDIEEGLKIARQIKIKADTQARLQEQLTALTTKGGE